MNDLVLNASGPRAVEKLGELRRLPSLVPASMPVSRLAGLPLIGWPLTGRMAA